MYNLKYVFFVLTIVCISLGCKKDTQAITQYEDHIGDTPFDTNLDDVSFTFCDSTHVLHKRALIKYKGGFIEMQDDLIKAYQLKESYRSFTGSIIIRFAVNCQGKLGRFRSQIVDSKFSKSEAPKGLKSHLFSILKNMKGWTQAYYEDQYSDCYTFIVIKFNKGTISLE